MKKVALVIFLFLTSFPVKAADGDSIWGANFIHDIYFNFTQPSYWDTLIANYSTSTYMSCEMIFDGTVLPSTAIRMKGNSSFNNPSQKKSFKVDLNEYVAGQDYDGIKKFNLNNLFKDPSFIREKLTLDYMRRHGMHAPRCTYARVYLNNVYWGLYTIVEDVNSKFLSQHYGNNNGNLYKGDPQGDLQWFGSSATSYMTRYEMDQTQTNDWTDLVDLIDAINNSPTSTYYNDLETKLFGIDAIQNMVINNMFVNLDSYCGSGHNYYIYHDSLQGVFRWIPWDVNEAFGTFRMNMTPTQLKNLAFDYVSQANTRPLATKMLADPTYKQIYIYSYCYLMDNFTNAYLDPYIDSVANMIRADVYADNLKTYSNQQFEDNLTMDITVSGPMGNETILGLKNFITSRRSSLTTQLAPYGCYLSSQDPQLSNTELRLYPNPTRDFLSIEIPSEQRNSALSLEIFEISGRVVLKQDFLSPAPTVTVSTFGMSPGAYFLKLSAASGRLTTARFTVSAE
jgi:hypothetical protein